MTRPICTPWLAILLLLACANRLYAAPVKFGVAGDSLSDEYTMWAPLLYQSPTALSWVDQLATYRPSEIDFGTFGASDDGPRFGGYEYNYARLGATSSTLLSEGQHTGLASEPVQLVYVGIGTNDFSALEYAALGLHNIYGGVYSGATNSAPLVAQLVANVTSALDAIAGPPGSPTGVQVIVGNVGDWGVTPYARSHGYNNPLGRARVTDAIIEANAQIRAIALARGMPVVDVFGLWNLQVGIDPLTIGGVNVNLGAAPSDDQHYFTLPDGIHPGTLWQGLLGNAILAAAHGGYGTDLAPFSDQELLAHAGIADPHGGSLTSYYPVGEFVETAAVPEPDALLLITAGVLVLGVYGRCDYGRWRSVAAENLLGGSKCCE